MAGITFPVDDVEKEEIESNKLVTSEQVIKLFYEDPHEVVATGVDAGSTNWLSSKTHGLFSAMFTAFNGHHSLILSPDHMFQMILEGWSEHVSYHSDTLRPKFVKHSEKKRLVIHDNDSTIPWGPIIQEFCEQIKANTNEKLCEIINVRFSTTTSNEIICRNIALMDTVKHYFEFKRFTKCGFPEITLTGLKKDWICLKQSIDALKNFMMDDFASKWILTLHSIVDKFIDAFDGHIDKIFWGSMVKYNSKKGSGNGTFITGWVNGLFPYLSNELNELCIPWQELEIKIIAEGGPHKVRGNRVEYFERTFCVAPVEWICLGKRRCMELKSSIIGAQSADGKIVPQIAWAVVELQ